MKNKGLLLAFASVLVLGGCVRFIDAANSSCGRRVDADRRRCLRNNSSNDAALASRHEAERSAKVSWAAQTVEGIEAAAGRPAP
jgi:osmotically-inducible protein OsmY